MMRNRVSGLFSLGAKGFSSSPSTAGALGVSKRDDYYKTLAEQVDDSRPPDWDSARPYKEIPGPEPLSLLGHVLRLVKFNEELPTYDYQKQMHLLNKSYGDTVITKGITKKYDHVIIFDPNDIEKAHRNTGPYPIRYIAEALVYYRSKVRKEVFQGVPGLLALQGEPWFNLRSVINPILMQPKTVHQYVSKIDNALNQLIIKMRHLSKLDQNHQMPEDFVCELEKWVMDSIGAVTLGRTYEEHQAVKFARSVSQALSQLHDLETRPPLWRFFPTPLYKNFVNDLDVITDFLVDSIKQASTELIDDTIPEDQLSIYHRLAKQDKRVALTIAMDLIIGGIDTTSKTLGGLLYLLAKHPEKQANLREELRRNLPKKDTPLSAEVLSKSPYLKAVVKEAYRIAPVAGGSLRVSIKNMVLGGYQIPKGTTIFLTTLCSINSEKYFKDPEKFHPERWLRSNNDEYSAKNAHPFASLAFGAGPRSCVGMRLATLELELAVMKIIRHFELAWNHPDVQYESRLFTYIKDPLKLTVKEVE